MLMRLLKKLIKVSNIHKHDKATIWTVATIGFAGALKIHEILAKNGPYFDPDFTLLKEDLRLTSATSEGESIGILQIKAHQSPQKMDKLHKTQESQSFGS